MDVPPWTQAPRIRVRLRLGRHCIRHPAWAVIQHHTPGYTPVPGTWHPDRDCPFRASNNRPETNPLHCPGQTHSATTTGGALEKTHSATTTGGGALETTHRAPPPGTHGSLARPTVPYTNICILRVLTDTALTTADWGVVDWGTTQPTHQNSVLDWTDCHVPRVNPTHWHGP
jgi:hypothetical protein